MKIPVIPGLWPQYWRLTSGKMYWETEWGKVRGMENSDIKSVNYGMSKL